MDDSLIWRFALMAVLLLGSAFFAGCDIALFSLTSATVHRLKQSAGGKGARVAALLANPQRLLVTVYVGNELINVAISAIATFVALDLFGSVGVAISLGFGVFILLIFGEITPKAFAHNNNEKWALAAAYPLTVFMWSVYPVQLIVTWISDLIVRALGGGGDAAGGMLDEEDFKSLVEESAGEGIIGEEEKEMIQKVFELGDVTVSEVMTPRTDILALEVDTPLKEAWDKMADSYFARAPVYKDTIDNIVGVLFKKDLLKLDYPPPEDVNLENLVREPYIVPETKMIKELLREFRKRKVHLAIVMDEYGGAQGIATMDDVLEELVGESKQASGRNGEGIVRLGAGAFRVFSSVSLEKFSGYFETSLKHDEIETVGGYVFHLFGRAPQWGESIEDSGFKFTVEKVKGHRIIEIRVTRAPEGKTVAKTAEEGG
ncbi:MAG TPA: HlyC/CorC family transporter [Nitrospirae bacterium]|nr:HlyC/CorC family transporter [Nitrospirota bacterium]